VEMPVTAAAPDELIGSMILLETVMDWLEPPSTNPVIAAPPVTLLMVFEATLVPTPLKSTVIPVMVPVGVVFATMLLNVLLVIVFVGPLAPDAPSMTFHPAMVVVPLTVTFEKLLRLFVMVDPLTDDPVVASKNVTVPPLAPLLNAVTMELLFTFSLPVAVIFNKRVKNVTLPLVFTSRLVNVLLLTFVVVELALLHVM
jgi:hypothetical protein